VAARLSGWPSCFWWLLFCCPALLVYGRSCEKAPDLVNRPDDLACMPPDWQCIVGAISDRVA